MQEPKAMSTITDLREQLMQTLADLRSRRAESSALGATKNQLSPHGTAAPPSKHRQRRCGWIRSRV